jgi:tripartite-type tricarboxylate transporter receptor subunit TctC
LTGRRQGARRGERQLPVFAVASKFYPKFEAQSWVGVLAPAATPRHIVERLNTGIIKTLAASDIKVRFILQGYETVGGTPRQFGKWIRSVSEKWGKVFRDQNISVE